MVKKLQKMADRKAERRASGPAGLLEGQLAQSIKDSAQQIWLAGLGAFSKAQGDGSKVFETLMKEGVSLHRKTQAVAEEKIGDVAGKMSAMAGSVGDKANAHWDKLESIFEERTARALNKLGVPTAKDVAALSERVEALAAAVAALGAGPAPKPASKAARKPASKPATKTSSTPAVKAAAKPAAKKVAVKRSRKPAADGAAA